MTNSLVAFALVAEEYEKSGDPVRGLVPLFRPILQERSGNEFDPNWFAEQFTNTYGLAMTPYVAKSISENLASVGLLKPREGFRDQFSIANMDELQNDVPKIDEDSIRETVGYFERWSGRELRRLNIDSTGVEFEAVLLGRLAHPEFASVFLEKGQPRDSERIKRLLGRGDFEEKRNLDQLFDFLVARFLLVAHETAPEVFDQLASIAFGALIADAVAGIASPGVLSMPEPPLRVAIDGPLLLDVLDLSTPAHFEYSKALFDMMSRAKFRLVTFDHVVDEVRESIQSTLRAHSGSVAYGPLGDRLRSKPGLSVRANSVVDTLDERLKEFGVDVIRSEIYERSDFKKYFNDESVDRVRNAIGDVHHQLDRRIRDTQSVAAVVRLKRDNRRPSSVFEAGTIFLTRNSALAKQVNRALAVGRSEPDPRFTVITDGQLASTLWFSLGAASDFASFSKKRLIANCSSAIVTQREVIQRIASMLEAVDEDLKGEFEVLMRDKRASLCAMRMTGGFAESIDRGLSQKVLEEMRLELAAPLVEEALEQLSVERLELVRLQDEVNSSRQVNVTLQEVIGANQKGFSSELAQMSIALEGERVAKDRLRGDLSGLITSCDHEIERLEPVLRRRRETMSRVLVGIWMLACTIALFLSIFPELISGNRSRAIVFFVLLTTIGFFKSWVDRLINKTVNVLSSTIVGRIEDSVEKKQHYQRLYRQLGPE